MTLEEVINEARDGHEAFTEQNIPGAVLRRKLNRYQRELYAVVVDVDPQWVATVETIDLATYDFSNGFTPSATFNRPLGGDVYFDTASATDPRTERLKWVPYRNRKRPTVPWPAYYLDGTIYLCGISEDWDAVDKVDVHFISEPTAVSAPSDSFDLPPGANPALVARAELEMAKRGPVSGDGNQPDVQVFSTLFERAEKRFIDELRERDSAEEAYVREEW